MTAPTWLHEAAPDDAAEAERLGAEARTEGEREAAEVRARRDAEAEQRAAEFREVAERLAKHGPSWAPFTVPPAQANNGQAAIAPALAPFERAPLGARMREGLPPYRHLVPGLAYTEGLHWYYGAPKSGKSFLARWIAREAFAATGKPTVWLDHEMGLRQTGLALQDIGMDGDEADAMFWQVDFPAIAGLPMPAVRARLEATVKAAGAGMVVIDSVGKQLALLGLSENENAEVTRWTAEVLLPAADAIGVPVLVIDHMAKAGDGGSARGAGEKMASALAAFHVSSDGFSTTEAGIVTRHATYDRPGRMPRKLYYRVGGQGEGEPLAFVEVDEDEVPRKPGPKATGDARRGDLLALYGDLGARGGEGLTLAGVTETLDVSESTARKALRDAGFAAVENEGGRGREAHWHVRGAGF